MSIPQAVIYGIDLALVAAVVVLTIVYLREVRRIRANRKRGLPWSPIAKLPDQKPKSRARSDDTETKPQILGTWHDDGGFSP